MLLRVATFAALGGFLFGYDLGLIGGALLGIHEDLGVHRTITQEAIVGGLKFGAFVGTFIGGALMLRYGRRTAIAATSITSVLGPVIMAVSSNSGGLIVGRLVSGLGIGVCAIVVPAYLAEIAPAQQRGAVVQMYEFMLTIGMLTATLIDFALQNAPHGGWRWMVGLPAVPGATMGLALLVLPESPRWLVMRNDLDGALMTLQRVLSGGLGPFALAGTGLAGKQPSHHDVVAQAEDELLLLWSAVEKDKHAVLERRQQLAFRRRMAAAAKASGRREHLLATAGTSPGGPAAPHAGVQMSDQATAGAQLEQAGLGVADLALPGPAEPSQSLAGHGDAHNGPAPLHTASDSAAAAHIASGAGHAHTGTDHAQDVVRVGGGSSRHDRGTVAIKAKLQRGQDGGEEEEVVFHGAGKIRRARDDLGTSLLSGFESSTGSPRGTPRSKQHQQQRRWWSLRKEAPSAPTGADAAEDQATGQAGSGGESAGGMEWVEEGRAGVQGQPGQLQGTQFVLDEDEELPQQQQQQQQQLQQLGQQQQQPGEGTEEPGDAVPLAMPGEERNFLRTLLCMLMDVYAVAAGEERRAFLMALALAFFNQATASTAVINYAPTVLQRLGGVSDGQAMLFTAAIALTKVLGVGMGLVTVDLWGRRPLLIGGSAGCALSMVLLTVAAAVGSIPGVVMTMCTFILAFSISWAGVYWVLVSEIFSMSAKSPASSAATSLLFLTGAITNLLFMSLVEAADSLAFLLFGGVAAVSGIYVWWRVPETKGRPLAEVQALLAGALQPGVLLSPSAASSPFTSMGGAITSGGGAAVSGAAINGQEQHEHPGLRHRQHQEGWQQHGEPLPQHEAAPVHLPVSSQPAL